MKAESRKADSKKKEVRERIILAAADLFLKKGSRAVSLEEVAQAADVSRRTLFNYFDSKDDLVYAATEPVLREAISLAEEGLSGATSGIDDIVALCLALWKSCGPRLGLLHAIGLEESPRLSELHAKFLAVLRRLIDRAVAGAVECSGSARLVGKLVYHGFVPLLLALDGEDAADERFSLGMRGMIAGATGRRQAAGCRGEPSTA